MGMGGPVVATATPPLYANNFEVTRGEYDVTVKFSQRDPYLDKLAEDETTSTGVQARMVRTQLPSAIVAMSPDAAKAFLAELREALDG